VVAGWVDGYRAGDPGQPMGLKLSPGTIPFEGGPALVAQMLDKLLANAGGVAKPGPPIQGGLGGEIAGGGAGAGDGGAAPPVRLDVVNEGPPLPLAMDGRLFDSMVSVREERSSGGPHLGLGLYIVRLIAEFHGGRARAANRSDGDGVRVSVVLPLVRALR